MLSLDFANLPLAQQLLLSVLLATFGAFVHLVVFAPKVSPRKAMRSLLGGIFVGLLVFFSIVETNTSRSRMFLISLVAGLAWEQVVHMVAQAAPNLLQRFFPSKGEPTAPKSNRKLQQENQDPW